MKKIVFSLICLLSVCSAFAATDIDEVPNVHVADSTKFVSNPDGILSPVCVDSLNLMLRLRISLTIMSRLTLP